MRYAVYLPPGHSAGRPWPAALFLHGIGERGEDGVGPTRVGIGPALLVRPEIAPLVVVLPQCHPALDWRDPAMEQGALAALDETIAEHGIDTTRVYLTGISMGGIGAWRIGASHPERFAAVVPICGIGDPTTQVKPLQGTPVWCFHGSNDAVIPAECSRDMVEALRRAGGEVRYSEYEGVGHDSWTQAYGEPELYRWLLERRKPARGERH